jgi:hypothetical protein
MILEIKTDEIYMRNNTYQLENKRSVPNEKTQPNQRHKNERIFFFNQISRRSASARTGTGRTG